MVKAQIRKIKRRTRVLFCGLKVFWGERSTKILICLLMTKPLFKRPFESLTASKRKYHQNPKCQTGLQRRILSNPEERRDRYRLKKKTEKLIESAVEGGVAAVNMDKEGAYDAPKYRARAKRSFL